MRTFGVEEEMFLVDPASGHLVGAAPALLRQDSAQADDAVEHELFESQIETRTVPHRRSADLEDELLGLRARTAAAAEVADAAVVATGTPPLGARRGTRGEQVTAEPRYRRMRGEFAEVGRRALVCGMHVHVQVEAHEAVTIIDGLRPWLPVVMALAANSPFDRGHDTGFASWRGEVWDAWPSAGPREAFGDLDGYRDASRALVAAGAAIDEAMLYYDARIAREHPTVEIRVADVCTDVGSATAIAALVRALVDTEAAAAPRSEPWRVDLLRAARWRAHRHGVADALVHPLTRSLVPSGDAVQALLDHVGPALEASGDDEVVRRRVGALLEGADGASAQRAAAGPRADLAAVVADLVRRTAAPGDRPG